MMTNLKVSIFHIILLLKVKDESDFSNSVVLAALMSKTSNKYRTLKEKNRYLNFLYGASFLLIPRGLEIYIALNLV